MRLSLHNLLLTILHNLLLTCPSERGLMRPYGHRHTRILLTPGPSGLSCVFPQGFRSVVLICNTEFSWLRSHASCRNCASDEEILGKSATHANCCLGLVQLCCPRFLVQLLLEIFHERRYPWTIPAQNKPPFPVPKSNCLSFSYLCVSH